MKEILHNLAFGGGKLTTANRTSSTHASRAHSCSRLPLLLATVMIALFAVQAKATEVTMDFTTSAGLSAMGLSTPSSSNTAIAIGTGKYTQNNVTLTATNGTTNTRVFYSSKGISLRVYKGGSITLSVPEGATIKSVKFSIYGIENKGCFTTSTGSFSTTEDWSTKITPEWTSSEEKDSVKFTVAQSSSNSKSPQVQLKAITVTYSVSGKTDSKIQLSETSFAYTTENYASFTAPTATVVNASTNEEITDATVTYSSNKEDVATVTDNVVSLTGTAGTATITATYSGDDTYNGSSASYTITVTNASEPVVEGSNLEFTFEPTEEKDGTLTNAPQGVTKTFENTYGSNASNINNENKKGIQITKDKSMTLKLTNLPIGYKIEGISLNVHNNSGKNGKGTATATFGSTTLNKALSISGYGNTQWTEVAMTLTSTPVITSADDTLSIVIKASENSVYCDKFIIKLVPTDAAEKTSLTSSKKDWGTVCLPYTAQVVEGTKLYTVEGSSDEGIVVEEKTDGILVAGTPYIYKAAGSGYFYKASNSEVTEPVAGKNNLVGVLTASQLTGEAVDGIYILPSDGVWHEMGTGATVNLTKNRAYLTSRPAAVSEVKSSYSVIDTDEVTAINGVNADSNATAAKGIYTLAGQRVSTMTKGGIYIVNGKKVLVK